VHQELQAEGLPTSPKRVARLMREDGLAARPRKRYRVATTNSNHDDPIAPNLLARQFDINGVGLNRVWVADITYIPTREGALYLATVLDLGSRRCVGWAMRDTLEVELALSALRMAQEARRPAPGLIHHSDRGVQYACGGYVKRLEAAGITISMSRPGNPYDNAWAESFMKTLKVEEVDGRRYRNFDHAEALIGIFIEELYNEHRLHSALDYLSPIEFEAGIAGRGGGISISTKKEKRSKKERNIRKGRPVETAAAEEIRQRWPSATSS